MSLTEGWGFRVQGSVKNVLDSRGRESADGFEPPKTPRTSVRGYKTGNFHPEPSKADNVSHLPIILQMSIVLIGYRGSGKTTVGRLLADGLGKPFIDIDDSIVARTGRNIRQIFEQDGEAAFRDHEANALEEALDRMDHIVSVGGGAIERESNRTLLAKAGNQVFYLRCDPQELLRRIQDDTSTFASRPPLTPLGGGIAEIRAVLSRREPIYRSVMTDEIDVTRLRPGQTVALLLERIRRAD